MKFLLAKKVNMTQVFDETGAVEPVTVLMAGPVVVTQVKTPEKDGYRAVQVSTKATAKREKRKEYRLKEGEEAPILGDTMSVDLFSEGDKVIVSSISKGKGFQGVVKRHGFAGGRRTHGQKHSEREPGSIGGGGRAGGRVVKGMRMAGRMGSDRVTVKNLMVVKVIPETNEIMIRGAIPGRRGTIVEIKSI
jgi:large subunit ribosomal protein L3